MLFPVRVYDPKGKLKRTISTAWIEARDIKSLNASKQFGKNNGAFVRHVAGKEAQYVNQQLSLLDMVLGADTCARVLKTPSNLRNRKLTVKVL